MQVHPLKWLHLHSDRNLKAKALCFVWFVCIWLASVAALGIVAYAIRWALHP